MLAQCQLAGNLVDCQQSESIMVGTTTNNEIPSQIQAALDSQLERSAMAPHNPSSVSRFGGVSRARRIVANKSYKPSAQNLLDRMDVMFNAARRVVIEKELGEDASAEIDSLQEIFHAAIEQLNMAVKGDPKELLKSKPKINFSVVSFKRNLLGKIVGVNPDKKQELVSTKKILKQVVPQLSLLLKNAAADHLQFKLNHKINWVHELNKAQLENLNNTPAADPKQQAQIAELNVQRGPIQTYYPIYDGNGKITSYMLETAIPLSAASFDRRGITGQNPNFYKEISTLIDLNGKVISEQRGFRSGAPSVLHDIPVSQRQAEDQKLTNAEYRTVKVKEQIQDEFRVLFYDKLQTALSQANPQDLTPEGLQKIIQQCSEIQTFRMGLLSPSIYTDEHEILKRIDTAYEQVCQEGNIDLTAPFINDLCAKFPNLQNLNGILETARIAKPQVILMNFGTNPLRGLDAGDHLQEKLNAKANVQLLQVFNTKLAKLIDVATPNLKTKATLKSIQETLSTFNPIDEKAWKSIRAEIMQKIDELRNNIKYDRVNLSDLRQMKKYEPLFQNINDQLKSLCLLVAHCDKNLAPQLSIKSREYITGVDARDSIHTLNNNIAQEIAVEFAASMLGDCNIQGCKSGKDRTASAETIHKALQVELGGTVDSYILMNKDPEGFMHRVWDKFVYINERTVSRELLSDGMPGITTLLGQNYAEQYHHQMCYPGDISKQCDFELHNDYARMHKYLQSGFSQLEVTNAPQSSPRHGMFAGFKRRSSSSSLDSVQSQSPNVDPVVDTRPKNKLR